jgi:hypothetical protein
MRLLTFHVASLWRRNGQTIHHLWQGFSSGIVGSLGNPRHALDHARLLHISMVKLSGRYTER